MNSLSHYPQIFLLANDLSTGSLLGRKKPVHVAIVCYVQVGQARKRTRKGVKMKVLLAKVMSRVMGHREAGMATAEYAVGTVAAISLGGVLVSIIQQPFFRDTVFGVMSWILGLITGAPGA